ncbi:MAG: hypothetical protein ACRDD9_04255, partial [Shewanella sp.]
MNNQQFKRTAIASLTALYVSGACTFALADPGMEKVAGSSFYTPTFTAEDVLKVTNERKADLSGDIYVGTPGQVNRVKKARTPEEIFQPEANSQGI